MTLHISALKQIHCLVLPSAATSLLFCISYFCNLKRQLISVLSSVCKCKQSKIAYTRMTRNIIFPIEFVAKYLHFWHVYPCLSIKRSLGQNETFKKVLLPPFHCSIFSLSVLFQFFLNLLSGYQYDILHVMGRKKQNGILAFIICYMRKWMHKEVYGCWMLYKIITDDNLYILVHPAVWAFEKLSHTTAFTLIIVPRKSLKPVVIW